MFHSMFVSLVCCHYATCHTSSVQFPISETQCIRSLSRESLSSKVSLPPFHTSMRLQSANGNSVSPIPFDRVFIAFVLSAVARARREQLHNICNITSKRHDARPDLCERRRHFEAYWHCVFRKRLRASTEACSGRWSRRYVCIYYSDLLK